MARKKPKRTSTELLKRVLSEEVRAYSHDADLKADGMVTGAIFPKRPQDLTDERTARKYLKRLERFNGTDYVAGYEGTPIRADVVARMEHTLARWNADYRAQLFESAQRPYITGGRPSDVTLHEYLMQERAYADRMNRGRRIAVDALKTNAQAERIIRQMERQMRPGYAREYVDRMREVQRDTAYAFNDKKLMERLENMSDSQIFLLLKYTDFQSIYNDYYMHVSQALPDYEAMEEQGIMDSLMADIEFAENAVVEYGPSWLGELDPFAPRSSDSKAVAAARSLARRAQQGVSKLRRKHLKRKGRRR
mgnify:FL=1